MVFPGSLPCGPTRGNRFRPGGPIRPGLAIGHADAVSAGQSAFSVTATIGPMRRPRSLRPSSGA